MSLSSSTSDASTGDARTEERRVEFDLPGGQRLVVICRYFYNATVPVIGPPKPPKGPCFAFPIDDVVVTVETEVTLPG